MKKKILFVALLSVATVFSASAQKFKPSPKFMKGEKQINVVFDFSKVKFDGDSQTKYYAKKSSSWIEEWEGTRRENNKNIFVKSLNDELQKVKAVAGAYPEANYTTIVDVVDCDFGAFAGPFSVEAKLKCTVRIVKTGTTETLSSITLEESQNPHTKLGTPVDFDRIALAFGEVGEELGDKLVKLLK